MVYETAAANSDIRPSAPSFCELFFNSNGGNVSMADYRVASTSSWRRSSATRIASTIKKLEICDTDRGRHHRRLHVQERQGPERRCHLQHQPWKAISSPSSSPTIRMPRSGRGSTTTWMTFENVLHGPNFADPNDRLRRLHRRRLLHRYPHLGRALQEHRWLPPEQLLLQGPRPQAAWPPRSGTTTSASAMPTTSMARTPPGGTTRSSVPSNIRGTDASSRIPSS